MKKAVVIGASSGIGRALAKVFAENGFEVGLAARRIDKLEELNAEISGKTYIKRIDVTAHGAGGRLRELIDDMGGADIIVIGAGVSVTDPDCDYSAQLTTIKTNVEGFAAMTCAAVKYFMERGRGRLAGISSVAALRGSAVSPAYNASKAFVSNYLEGIRQQLRKTKISVTDIRPGFIDTPLIKGHDWAFWTVSAECAARQIFRAIIKRKRAVYIPKRWNMIALLMRLVPGGLYDAGFCFLSERKKRRKK